MTPSRRLTGDEGFTLIEILVVIIILGILLAIAIPSYLSFRNRANNAAAQSNIRSAVPALEAFNDDNATSGYAGATSALLRSNYDRGLKGFQIVNATTTTYCLMSRIGTGAAYMKKGPGADIARGDCT